MQVQLVPIPKLCNLHPAISLSRLAIGSRHRSFKSMLTMAHLMVTTRGDPWRWRVYTYVIYGDDCLFCPLTKITWYMFFKAIQNDSRHLWSGNKRKHLTNLSCVYQVPLHRWVPLDASSPLRFVLCDDPGQKNKGDLPVKAYLYHQAWSGSKCFKYKVLLTEDLDSDLLERSSVRMYFIHPETEM